VKLEIKEEATYDDIGRELGISPNHARTVCMNALRKVAKACRKFGIDASCIIGRPVSMLASAEEKE
jgi:hypothetical protein